jgi:hypothetical protein
VSGTTTAPRVDISALAASLYGEAAERIAQVVVLTIDRLDERGLRLSQLQKIELAQTALVVTEGLEAHFAEDLKRTLENDGVATWGLSDDLERMLGGDDARG